MPFGPRMSPSGDGKQLIMTYDKGVYSFQCDTPNQCYWNTENHELGISRFDGHIMMTVPTSLVENCGCELNSTGDCKCPAAVTGQECDRCKDGYWGLNKNGVMGCSSKFYRITLGNVSFLCLFLKAMGHLHDYSTKHICLSLVCLSVKNQLPNI